MSVRRPLEQKKTLALTVSADCHNKSVVFTLRVSAESKKS